MPHQPLESQTPRHRTWPSAKPRHHLQMANPVPMRTGQGTRRSPRESGVALRANHGVRLARVPPLAHIRCRPPPPGGKMGLRGQTGARRTPPALPLDKVSDANAAGTQRQWLHSFGMPRQFQSESSPTGPLPVRFPPLAAGPKQEWSNHCPKSRQV